MDIAILIIAILFALAGLAGSVIPALPGPPLSWIALLLLKFYPSVNVSTTLIVIMGIIAAVITAMDYIIPSISTKKFGGSKASVWGCNIGVIISIIGLPFGPQGVLGIIIWPFIGAFVGEFFASKNLKISLHSATGALIGFLCGTGLKLIYASIIIFMMIYQFIK